MVLDEHFVMAINWTIAVCLFCYCSMQTEVEGHLSCFACACKVLIASNSFKLRLTLFHMSSSLFYIGVNTKCEYGQNKPFTFDKACVIIYMIQPD